MSSSASGTCMNPQTTHFLPPRSTVAPIKPEMLPYLYLMYSKKISLFNALCFEMAVGKDGIMYVSIDY